MGKILYPRAADIAAAYGVAQKTVYAWAKRGLIPCYRIGHNRFFDWKDIELLMCKNRYIGGSRRPAASFNDKGRL